MSFKITILGSSGAIPAYGRYPSAQLIQVEHACFLVDCGEGTQMQLMRLNVPLNRIGHVLISHLHGDHFLGLMGLIYTMHLHHRENRLHIHSHRGLDEIITSHFRYSQTTPLFDVVYHELTPGLVQEVFSDTHLTVETIPLKHKINCSGFLFREKGKPFRINKDRLPPDITFEQIAALKQGKDVLNEDGSVRYARAMHTLPPRRPRTYAYCSDTTFDPSLAGRLNAVDVIYHEATFLREHADKAAQTMHSTAEQAATLARNCNAGKLLIGHFSARYREIDPLLLEARAVFQNTYLARDGDVFEIDS